MATRYLKSAGGNWDAAATWSATGSGGGDSAGAPTASDDVILESGSGNLTINAAAACRSFDCTSGTGSYAGTVTHNAAIALSVGTSTAGAGNVALKLVSGMTYTLGNVTTSSISFISTSTTQQDVDFAGKTTGNVTFNGSGGSWKYVGTHVTGATATVTLTAGTLDTNGYECTWGFLSNGASGTRTLNLGASTINIIGSSAAAWNVSATSGGTFSSSTINMSGATAWFYGGNKTYGTLVFTNDGDAVVRNANTFTTLTRTGAASKKCTMSFGGTTTNTITNLNLNGNSSVNRLLVAGDTSSNATLSVTNLSVTNADFYAITGSGSASWDLSAITGNSGDCGLNSGITFTTAAAQTATGTITTTTNWSDLTWTSRVPLPQDDATLNITVNNTGLVMDMQCSGKNVDFSGITPSGASPAIRFNQGYPIRFFGSVTMKSTSIGYSFANTPVVFLGSGTHTLTNNGMSWMTSSSQYVQFASRGGSYTMQDAYSYNGTGSTFLTIGTLDTGNYNFTTYFLNSSYSSGTRTLNLGSSTVTLTGATNNWVLHCALTGGLTINAGTSTVIISSTSGTQQWFYPPNGQAFYNVQLNANSNGSSGATRLYMSFSVSNEFKVIGPKMFGADSTTNRTITLTPSCALNMTGSSGSVITCQNIASSTGKTIFSKASGTISCNYLTLSYSDATGGATFYAGANSTNSGNNTGWIFANPPNFFQFL